MAAALDSGGDAGHEVCEHPHVLAVLHGVERARTHAVVRRDPDHVDRRDPASRQQIRDGLALLGGALEDRVGGHSLPFADVHVDAAGGKGGVVVGTGRARDAVRRPGVDEVWGGIRGEMAAVVVGAVVPVA